MSNQTYCDDENMFYPCHPTTGYCGGGMETLIIFNFSNLKWAVIVSGYWIGQHRILDIFIFRAAKTKGKKKKIRERKGYQSFNLQSTAKVNLS